MSRSSGGITGLDVEMFLKDKAAKASWEIHIDIWEHTQLETFSVDWVTRPEGISNWIPSAL